MGLLKDMLAIIQTPPSPWSVHAIVDLMKHVSIFPTQTALLQCDREGKTRCVSLKSFQGEHRARSSTTGRPQWVCATHQKCRIEADRLISSITDERQIRGYMGSDDLW